MAANTSDRAVIGFVKDYDERELREKMDYQVTDGGVKSHLSVGISYGESTEYYFLETVDKLEDVRDATQGGWTPAKRFKELKRCLKGDALESYKKLVANNYPNPADKTNANYDALVRLIPTDLGDHPYPGNKIRQYLLNKVRYKNYRREDGKRYRPTDFLRRLRLVRELGDRTQHSMPAGDFLTDDEFLQTVWNSFPREMQD